MHDVGGMRAADVAAQQLAAIAGDELEQSAVGLIGHGAAIGAEGYFAHGIIHAGLAALGLGKAHGGCLWIGEHGRGHKVKAYAVSAPQDVVDAPHALHQGGVGQHATPVDVAYGIHALDACLHVVVNDDAAALCGYANRLKAKPLGVGGTARGYQHGVGLGQAGLALALVCHLQLSAALPDGAYGGLHDEFHATLLHGLAHTARYVLVIRGQAFFHELNHRDVTAEAVEHRRKLKAYHACAYDAQLLRQAAGVEQSG